MLNSLLIKYGKILRDNYLFDIYGSVNSYDFFKTNFLKNQQNIKFNNFIIHKKRAFS